MFEDHWDWTFTGGWKVMSATDFVDYLDDGYTLKGNIEAEAGVHGPLNFEYRPPLSIQIDQLIDADAKGREAYATVAMDLAAKQITKWDKTDREGKSVPCNRTTVARLNRDLFIKLVDAIFWPPKKGEEGADLHAKTGATEADLKN
jgi:hypothetical protein